MPSAGAALLYLVFYTVVCIASGWIACRLLKNWSQKRLNLHPERSLTLEEIAAVNLGPSGVVDVWLADMMLQKILTPSQTVTGNQRWWHWTLAGRAAGGTSVGRVLTSEVGTRLSYKQWHTRLTDAAHTLATHLFGRPSYLLWGLSSPLWVVAALIVYSTVAQVVGWQVAMAVFAVSLGVCCGVWVGIAVSSSLSPVWAYTQLKNFRAQHQSARMVPRRENLLEVVALIGLGGISQVVLARELGFDVQPFPVQPLDRNSGNSNCGGEYFASTSGGYESGSAGDGGGGCGSGGDGGGGGGCGD